MSKRNALLVAIVAVIVLAVVFLWPERARADLAGSVRIGGGVHHVGGLAHGGSRLGGRIHLGGRDFGRHRSHDRGRAHGRHGLLLGDRFRLHQQQRIGGPRAKGVLLGDRYRFEQRRRLGERFIDPDHRRGKHAHGHRGRVHDGKRHGFKGKGRKRHVHGHGRHRGKWLGPARFLLPYGGADVIVREIVVPVLVPVPATRPDDLSASVRPPELRGRATLVGEGEGVVGDWAAGDILPRDMPHVTLDAVTYGLPEPPPGEKYARVGNDVLRIDAGSRRIVEVIAR